MSRPLLVENHLQEVLHNQSGHSYIAPSKINSSPFVTSVITCFMVKGKNVARWSEPALFWYFSLNFVSACLTNYLTELQNLKLNVYSTS